ncbi:glutaredoxin-C9-like [Macadamia integrifolia]|uniref:glutaredoxin-C9-like n=1 Tax=Macadamia integrifolia TaxID=60698 RepID=UPI001C52D2F8|nr:glutaredoxin-C9-like [Macadamia integrifolia]
MQQAIPYRTWLPMSPSSGPIGFGGGGGGAASVVANGGEAGGGGGGGRRGGRKEVKGLISGNAVIVFGRRGCCMCHVVKRLLFGLGVNPAVYEVDDEKDEAYVVDELTSITAEDEKPQFQFPAVFIGGKLFGGLDRLMNAHISGELIPILKKAGALWL